MGTRERRSRSSQADRDLLSLFSDALNKIGEEKKKSLAIAAVGGYGRGELLPNSDLDILILHDGKLPEATLLEFVNSCLYPLWDRKIKIDHSVRSVEETITAASQDVRVMMGLLDIRLICGSPDLVADVQIRSLEMWRRDCLKGIPELRRDIDSRHARSGELAYLLEPDLKESRGGLRDITILRALALADATEIPLDRVSVAESTLLNIREELHLSSGRDKLLFQEQDRIAISLHFEDADALMAEVAHSARAVNYLLELTWYRIEHKGKDGLNRFLRRPRFSQVAKNILAAHREIQIEPYVDLNEDPVLPLRAAAFAAQLGIPLSLESTHEMARQLNSMRGALTDPWPEEAKEALVKLLGAGSSMIPVWEALDQEEILFYLIPEWRSVRSLPQRNALHRHTVDRHMVETAVHASALTRRVSRPDLLLVAALFHDLGKGSTEDHSVRGERLIEPLARRIGFDEADISTLKLLVKHHLLLSATATTRDLDNPKTIELVTSVIPDVETLNILHALSIADGEATGRAAWSEWKATLVNELVSRTRAAMAGQRVAPAPELSLSISDPVVTGDLSVGCIQREHDYLIEIQSPDRPGLLSIVAGVLNISRLDVRSARTRTLHSTAVMHWVVTPDPHAPHPDPRKIADLINDALESRQNLEKKIEERKLMYASLPSIPVPHPVVDVIEGAAGDATVIEVRSHDRPALLFTIGDAITQCRVDIRSAIVTTLGAEAIDTLYVTEIEGGALTRDRAFEVTDFISRILLK